MASQMPRTLKESDGEEGKGLIPLHSGGGRTPASEIPGW